MSDAAQPTPDGATARLPRDWRPAQRRTAVLLVLALAWEGYGRWIGNDLVFPSLTDTLAAFWRVTLTGGLPARAVASIEVLALGYGAGLLMASLLVQAATPPDGFSATRHAALGHPRRGAGRRV